MLVSAIERNEQLDFIHFGHNRGDDGALFSKIQARPRPVARLRADDMLNRLFGDAMLDQKLKNKLNTDGILLHPDQNSNVQVSYGRRPNVIGNLRCSATTSLAEMRYLITKNLSLADESYLMIAHDGTRAFPRHEEDKRHVLLDCGHNLQLRPSTWLTLAPA